MTARTTLRPGAAVHVVEEGLLLCGWRDATLVKCAPGATKVWLAIEPMLRDGVDPTALRDRLPARATPLVDALLSAMWDQKMLMDVTGDAEPGYLDCFAPDPAAAARAARDEVFRVTGEPGLATRAGRLMVHCGLRTDDRGVRIHVGDADGYVPSALAAIACGDRVLVTSGPRESVDAAIAALGRDSAGTPSALTWTVALAVLVDLAHQVVAGTADPSVCTVVSHAQARTVPLPPPLVSADARWVSVAERTTWQPPDTSALLTRVASVAVDMVGSLRGPLPGELVQLPMARQRMWFADEQFEGAGIDQNAAGRDAVLTAARRFAGPGGLAVAGDGLIDLLADVTGRSLVAKVDPPTSVWQPEGARAARWTAALDQETGTRPEVRCRTADGLVLATASVRGTTVWGYGADAETAAEHALRGLLKTVVVGGELGRVAVSHEQDAAAPLLCASLGIAELPDAPSADILRRLESRLLVSGGGWEAAGVLVGKVLT
jgi:hypothetical protein